MLVHDMKIFNEYSVEELAGLSPYSVNYISILRQRPARITRMFKAHMAAILGQTEEGLFGLPDDSQRVLEESADE